STRSISRRMSFCFCGWLFTNLFVALTYSNIVAFGLSTSSAAVCLGCIATVGTARAPRARSASPGFTGSAATAAGPSSTASENRLNAWHGHWAQPEALGHCLFGFELSQTWRYVAP